MINPHLVASLMERGLWDEVRVADLKYSDGKLSAVAVCRVDDTDCEACQ